jgi:hypothetical protein
MFCIERHYRNRRSSLNVYAPDISNVYDNVYHLLGSLVLAMLAFHCSEAIADRGLRMHHQNQHQQAWRFFVIMMPTLVVGLMAGRMRAHAQALDNATAPATNASASVGDVSPDAEPASIDEPATPAASGDTTTANRIDDSAPRPVSENPDVGSATPDAAMAPNEASGSSSEDGAVLELPQVVNLQNGAAVDQPPDDASAEDDDDDHTAQSATAGQNSAATDGLAAADDPLGTLQDYENQANQAPLGPVFLGPGVAVVRFPHPFFFNPAPRPLLGPPMGTPPVILPPTSSGPFPSTSPMLMAPRMGALGTFPRGGWGFHR